MSDQLQELQNALAEALNEIEDLKARLLKVESYMDVRKMEATAKRYHERQPTRETVEASRTRPVVQSKAKLVDVPPPGGSPGKVRLMGYLRDGPQTAVDCAKGLGINLASIHQLANYHSTAFVKTRRGKQVVLSLATPGKAP